MTEPEAIDNGLTVVSPHYECWCGESGDELAMHSPGDLDATCGGLGVLDCHCGGDCHCICHHHGETDCPGCPDCEIDTD